MQEKTEVASAGDIGTVSSPLSDEARAAVKDEVRHALALFGVAPREPKDRGPRPERVLAWFSNGFVLLVVGSLTTYFLVPYFQRQLEHRAERGQIVKECLTQFLLYANTGWQEYYAVLPLTLEPGLTKEQYVEFLGDTKRIKLARYDAFAHLEALSVVFRPPGSPERSAIEKALHDYAVRLNIISGAIDTWLRNMYCLKTTCIDTARGRVDSDFEPYGSFLRVQDLINESWGREQEVAELLVRELQGSE